MIDHIDHPHQQYELQRKRYQIRQWLIMFSFIEFILLLRNLFPISIIFCLDQIDLRLHFYHLDRISLHPQRYWQQDDLRGKCKQDDGYQIIWQNAVTVIHEPA